MCGLKGDPAEAGLEEASMSRMKRKITRREFVQTGAAAAGAGVGSAIGLRRAQAAAAEDALWRLFRDPPMAARPFVRWWWNGDKVVPREILRELDVMKAAGIGGFELNPIRFPDDRDPLNIPALTWLSPEWCAAAKQAAEGARERGLTADIIVGSGWPFGGRFLPREYQTRILTAGRRACDGPGTVTISEAEMLAGVELSMHSKHDDILKKIWRIYLTPASLDRFEAGRDLTGAFADGKLTFEAPPGPHVLHYLVVQTGFMAVINGAPGSDGPVLNHFRREAVEFYLRHMSEGMQPQMERLGDYFRAFFCDSLELEGANWCDDFLPEFERRRGYDVAPLLPFVLFKTGEMGNAVEDDQAVKLGPAAGDVVRRARYDCWVTLIELFRERFITPFAAWCRGLGGKSRAQAYGHGYDPVESSMLVDIPECESWLNRDIGTPSGRGYSMINKFVSSGARLAGKRLVSCEEITNTSFVFFAPLELIKITGDESNLSGVTHSILHGFNYSPPEAAFPGWVRYGTFFSERNPWWPFVRRWMDYKARLSALLQAAEPQANVAVLHPLADLWSRWGMQRDPFPKIVHPLYAHALWGAIHQNGHNCDLLTENILARCAMQDGTARFGSRSYDTLLCMELETIGAPAARALEAFADAGGKIIFIGGRPNRSPGLHDAEKNDRAVREAMQRIADRYAHTCVTTTPPDGELIEWFGRLRDRMNLEPDVRITPARWHVMQARHRAGDRDIYFFANVSRELPANFKAGFPIAGKTPWRWNPETGERSVFPYGKSKQNLELRLEPAESLLLVFEPGDAPAPQVEIPSEEQPQALTGPWRVDCAYVDGRRREISLDELRDLAGTAGLEDFAGMVTYHLEFSSQDAAGKRFLDLGRVDGVSEVVVNRRPLGCRWYGRHLYPLPERLEPGTNTLGIRVTTVLGNYCKSLKGNPAAQRWTRGIPPQPMGLLGPVRLLRGSVKK
jgi:hypothetical protein